jgi:hypothetical protein
MACLMAITLQGFVLSQSALCTSGSIGPNFVPPPGVKPPNFVTGDLNATVGQHVTFWHANWTNGNSLSRLFKPIHLVLHITKRASLAVAFASRAM